MIPWALSKRDRARDAAASGKLTAGNKDPNRIGENP